MTISASSWPLQSQCSQFYGNPRGPGGATYSRAWYTQNVVIVKPPFAMAMGTINITRIPFHRRCADALNAALEAIWVAAGRDQRVVDQWGMSVFSGSFNYRPMRGGSGWRPG